MAVGGLAQAFVRIRVDSSQIAADTNKGIEEGAAGSDAEKAGETTGERYSSGFNKAFKAAAIGALVFAALGAASIKSAIDFQTSMTKIQTQAGGSAADVKQLSAAVLKLAPSTQQGPLQLADALFHLKSVGLDNVQAMQALKTASDLAAVGGSNLEDTTNAIAGAWRSGISGAQNFGQAAATVNAIIGSGNMRMQDFVTAIGTGILPAARTFGVSLKQVGGALALMTDEGVPAVDAATRLKMSFSLLGAPSVTASKYLAQIGVSGLQLANAMRSPGGLVSAIGLLKSHLDASGLSASKQAILLSHAFGGGRSSSAILTMINNLDTLRKKQDQITTGIGKYGSAVAAQRQTVGAQLDILRSSLETIGVRMGTALLGPAIKFVHFISGSLIPGILSIGGVLGGVLRNPFGGAFLAGILAALVAFKAIIVATKLWAGALELVKVAMALSGIGLAVIAVAALAVGIAVLWERSSTFRKIVEGAFHGVLAAARDVWNWIKGHWKLLAIILVAPILPAVAIMAGLFLLLRKPVEALFGDIKKIASAFSAWWKSYGAEITQVWHDIWNPIAAVVELVWGLIVNGVKTGWNVLMGIVRPGIDLLETIFRAGWGLIMAVTRATWDLISGVVRSAWDVISGVVKIAVAGVESVVKIAWDVLVGIFDVALDLLTGKWGKAWDDIQRTATQVWNAIKGFFTSTVSDIERIFTGAWNSLLSGVKSWGSDLVGYFKTVPGMILRALGDVGKMLWNAGVAIIKGLIGGLKSAIGGIGHVMGSVGSVIKSFLPFSPAKQGPLSGKGDPYYSGLSIGNKVAAGIKAALPGLKSAVSGTVAQINSALSKAGTEKASGTSQLSKLTASQNALQAERKKEEASIQKLIAERSKEYAADKRGSAALRAEQEKQIKSLQKLRSTQETQVKATETVIKALRGEMTKLREETTKLTSALAKATKAAASSSSTSSSSSDTSSSSDSSSASASPNWAAFNQWTAATGPVNAAGGAAAGWQLNPGPLGGFGAGLGLSSGPGVAGRFGGSAGTDTDALIGALHAQTMRLDDLVEISRESPARTAQGLNAAMNGVVAHAMVKGGW